MGMIAGVQTIGYVVGVFQAEAPCFGPSYIESSWAWQSGGMILPREWEHAERVAYLGPWNHLLYPVGYKV